MGGGRGVGVGVRSVSASNCFRAATAGAERNSNVQKFRHKDTDGKTFRLTETQTKIHSD